MNRRENLLVTLVSMPWATTTRPSLSLGLLSAIIKRCGYPCDVLYPNIALASLMGCGAYEYLANTPSLFGVAEHLFAVDIFGQETLSSDSYLADTSNSAPEWPAALKESLLVLRDRLVPDFLNSYVEEILRRKPSVVGFTCTFNQVMASVALARRLKTVAPEIHVVLGGPCVHAEMGVSYSKIFRECVDAVFLGEADVLLPVYLDGLLLEEPPRAFRGIAKCGCYTAEENLFDDLDALPPPDYSDYFSFRDELSQNGFKVSPVHSLPFEASRGCWWGQKQHCTFCGLNNQGMRYRRKSAAVIKRELIELAESYSTRNFMAADNILDYRAYSELLPELTEMPTKLSLFFELKTNVRRSDVELLAKAGVSWVQPGIESFSDHVLTLMRKGATTLQNIQTLKWLFEYGIETSYNLLVGFPGETDVDYAEVIFFLRKLHHLPAPGPEAHTVQVQRFAPFHFAKDSFGIKGVQGARFYDYLIPPEVANKDDYAYFFDRTIPPDAPLHRNLEKVNTSLAQWCSSKRRLSLRLEHNSVSLKTAAEGRDTQQSLNDVSAKVLLLCDETIAEKDVVGVMCSSGSAERKEVLSTIESLETEGLLVRHRSRVLSLVPFDTPTTVEQIDEWLLKSSTGAIARSNNRRPQSGRQPTPLSLS